MKTRQLWFTGPRQVEVRERTLAPLKAGQVRVQTLYSAVSAGTEMLVYRGQLPKDMALDASLDSLQTGTAWPLQYGYACVGRVVRTAADVPASWQGKKVFAFQPHASHFNTPPAALMEIPDDIDPLDAVFLANMETAVCLAQDARPLLGENAVIIGQGVVGLLLASLLRDFPLAELHVLDRIAERRAHATSLDAGHVHNPASPRQLAALKKRLQEAPGGGADLVFEVSGNPDALNLAIALAGYTGRVIIGSWYGNKQADIALGGHAHRNRLNLVTSQVSTIAPALTGRWTKSRRFDVAWERIRQCRPGRLVTHRQSLANAPDTYKLLHKHPEQVLQAVFVYE